MSPMIWRLYILSTTRFLTPNKGFGEEDFIKGRKQVVEEEKKKSDQVKETVEDFNNAHIELIK